VNERIDRVVEEATRTGRIVGTVVLVSVDGTLVYQNALGFADRESGRPMTTDAVFRWASLTKPLTSVATLALVDRGVIGLDEPLTKFIPGFRPKLPSGEEPAILVRHLLTHTSGLTYALFKRAGNPYDKACVSDGLDAPGLSIEENLRRVASVPLLFAPGSGWHYSIATDVLGEVIARASGASLPKLIAELVTVPLGMSDTGFAPPERSRLATAYANAKPCPERMKAHHLLTSGEDTLLRAGSQLRSRFVPFGRSRPVRNGSRFPAVPRGYAHRRYRYTFSRFPRFAHHRCNGRFADVYARVGV